MWFCISTSNLSTTSNYDVESLSRHIASIPGFNGVKVGTGHDAVTVKSLTYADDICNPAETPGELQLVLNATFAWCSAWGMTLGLGMKKTEAVPFIPPRLVKHHGSLPLLTANGVPIEWVSEYRYLGYNMRMDLSEAGNIAAMAAKLTSRWKQYFHSSRLVWLHSPALILQLLKL